MFLPPTHSRSILTVLVLAIVPVAGESRAEGTEKPADKKVTRTDPYGDPLPEGVRTRLGTIRFRVQEGAEQLLISPNGKLLAISDRVGVALLDASSGKRLRMTPD